MVLVSQKNGTLAPVLEKNSIPVLDLEISPSSGLVPGNPVWNQWLTAG
jgi:hypothetical protein